MDKQLLHSFIISLLIHVAYGDLQCTDLIPFNDNPLSINDTAKVAKVKLNLDAECMDMRVVMEKDGTEIDEDEALVLLKEEAFMVLLPRQTWMDKDSIVTVSSVADVEAPPQMNRNEVSSPSLGNDPTVTTTPSISTSFSSSKISIPNFSDYVKAKLYSNESHLVWTKMIQEAAYHYMAHYPKIGINNSTDYREVGQQMVKEFPSIRREGPNPWSFFTSALSQKIRRVRWDNKRKSSPSPSHPKKVAKRFQLPTEASAEEEDDNCYEEHVKEMMAEMDKKIVDATHLKTLLKSTFKQRRVWVGTVPNGEVAPILTKFPCLKETRYILHEFRMILRVKNLEKYMERLQLLFQAASTLMKNGSSADDVEILRFIEVETGYKHGKGPKTKPIVEEKKNNSGSSFPLLLVVVNKVDTGPPVFPHPSYEANITELSPVGTSVFIFTSSGDSAAVDPDCAITIRYYLDQNDGGNFTINPNDGAVTVNGTVLYDVHTNYTLTVRATSFQGGSIQGEPATTTLVLTVLDVDNKGPAFTQETYHLNITEEIIEPMPALLHCFDQDIGINTPVLYSFTDMSVTSFTINSTTGQLVQVNTIDREKIPLLLIGVTCYQEDDPGKLDTALVEVTVLDVNDNLPVFETLDTNVTVMEHTTGVIATVIATDADEGDNAVIRYSLVEGDTAFDIDHLTGVISVKASELLDREATENITIVVRAEDLMGNFSQHNASVTVYLLDLNDNSPQFELDQYGVTFNISTNGTSIGMVVAHDADVINTPNSNVTYDVVDTWIVGGFAGGPFPLTLDHYIGEITITAFVQPELEYNMFVKACDNPTVDNDRRCSQARVTAEYKPNMTDHVYVTEINMTVHENMPSGSVIGQLPIYGYASYNISSSSFNVSSVYFSLDTQSNMLLTATVLDREVQDKFDFNLSFFSNNQKVVDRITVYLTVLDVNDNPPLFGNTEYYFSLPLQGSGNHVLGTLVADDKDTEENGDLNYILRQNQLKDWFTLDHKSGQLSLTESWWQISHRQPMYSLAATVSDGGIPNLQDTTLVHISNMEMVDNVSVMIYTEAIKEEINQNMQQLQRDMAIILGYAIVNIDHVEEVTSEQTFIRTKLQISASNENGTFVPVHELQRIVVARWYSLLALFQSSQDWVDSSSPGIRPAEIALVALGGVILIGGIILVPVVCRQWNKHVREHQLYDHLRRPSTIYDSQELRLDFSEETPRSQFSSFRSPYRVKEEGAEVEGSFGLAYVSPVFVDDDGNAPKTPTWSLNEQPRIPLWSTSDSLKDVMASLEDLSDRLNAEDNISGVTALSRNRSLKSLKSRNSETDMRDHEIMDWHADATLTDGTVTSVVQCPKGIIYTNGNNLSETTQNEETSNAIADSVSDGIILKANNPGIGIESTAF